MKVTCQSCQARYTIADDKVRGKVAKIRCKKCGTTILVDGTDGAPTIGQAPASGVAAADSLLGPSSEAAVEPLSSREGPTSSPAVADTAAAKPAIKAPEPVALRRPGRAASTDLFGGARGDDVMASAAAPVERAHAEAGTEKLTGARNENSVLFSLSALTGGSNAPATTADAVPNSRSADLRSLIGSPSGSPSSKDKSKLDDIMNLGGGGLYSPALISPALAPPPLELSVSAQESPGASKGRSRLFLIVGAVVLVGATAAAMTMLKTESAPTASKGSSTASTSTATLPPATASAAMAPTANSLPSPEAPAPAAAPPPEPTAMAAPTAVAPGQAQPKPEPEKKPAWTPPTPRTEKVAERAAPAEKPVDKPAPAPAPAPARPTAPPAGGTGEFDRAAAMSVLSNTALAVRNCKKPDGPTGAGRVAITYGNNGIATTATIEGPPFAGTAVGGCVAARFRATSVPPFGGSPITVHKSFTID